MTAPQLSERDFMAQVLELAHLRGWDSYHPRPGRTLDSWRTAGTGTMAKGFPDLVLARSRDHRLIFAELKRDGGKLSPDQERVLDALRTTHAEVNVWRPADWPEIERVLS